MNMNFYCALDTDSTTPLTRSRLIQMPFPQKLSNFFGKKKGSQPGEATLVERGEKSRQSTRSLPGPAERLRREGKRKSVAPSTDFAAQLVNTQNGVYVGGSAGSERSGEDVWAREAGPYYAPAPIQQRRGPRSLDVPLHNHVYGGSLCDYNRNLPDLSRGGSVSPDWSDTMSDMYRTERKLRKYERRAGKGSEDPRRRGKESRDYRRGGPSRRQNKYPSDISYGSDVNGGSSRNDSLRKSRENPRREEYRKEGGRPYDGIHVSQSHHESLYGRDGGSRSSHRRDKQSRGPRKSTSAAAFLGEDPQDQEEEIWQDPSRRYQSMPPPPRPPKSQKYGQAQWVDHPPDRPNALHGLTPRGHVTFDERQKQTPTPQSKRGLSPRGALSSATPPRSPGSAECDRLIIQTMRAELAEEKTLRLEAEKKITNLEKDKHSIQARIAELAALQGKMEMELSSARASLAKAEEEKKRFVADNQEKQDSLLDDIARRVANEVEESKKLKEEKEFLEKHSIELKSENEKLKSRCFDMMWENKVLAARLNRVSGNGVTESPSWRRDSSLATPMRHTLDQEAKPNMWMSRQSTGSDPAICMKEEMRKTAQDETENTKPEMPEGAESEKDSFSPLVNGRGEGMFSRPHSFAMDSSTSDSKSFTPRLPQKLVQPPSILFGVPLRPLQQPAAPPSAAPLLRYPQQMNSPLNPSRHQLVAGKPTHVIAPFDDDEDGDEIRNFAEPTPFPKSQLHHRTLDNSDASSVEKARAEEDCSTSSLHSEAFLRSLLSSHDDRGIFGRSTPKSSSSPIRSGSRTPTPSSSPKKVPTPISSERSANDFEEEAAAFETHRDDGYSTMSQLNSRSTTAQEGGSSVCLTSNPSDSGVKSGAKGGPWLNRRLQEWKEERRGSETSSGVSSEPNTHTLLHDPFTAGQKSSFSSEDLHMMILGYGSSERLENHRMGKSRSGMRLPFRRINSDSELFLRESQHSERLNLSMGCNQNSEFLRHNHLPLTEGNRSKSSTDFTQYEKELIFSQEQDCFDNPGDDLLVPNGSPERMCELGALPEETGEEAFSRSFYEICSNSFTSSPIPKKTSLPSTAKDGAMNYSSRSNKQSKSRKILYDRDTSGSADESSDRPFGRVSLYDDMLASTSGSFTSEESEEEGMATVGEWFKQLKRNKAKAIGKAVVRYTPPEKRASILKHKIFNRFGQSERKALAAFDFLQDQSTSGSSPEASQTNAPGQSVYLRKSKSNHGRSRRESQLEKRKSRSWSNLAEAGTVRDFTALVGKSQSGRRVGSWGNLAGRNSGASSPSHSSSLFLSDLCAADLSFSSSSSISFQCP